MCLLTKCLSVHRGGFFQVAAALSAAAVKASTINTQEGKKSSMPASMVISSIKQVLDVNGRDDFSVSYLPPGRIAHTHHIPDC